MKRVLLFILALNILVALAKGAFGLLAGSVSMVADAFHSSFDSISNIVGIVAITVASRPPDWAHPYGHGKFETLGTLVIGAMLLLTASWIVLEGCQRLVNPVPPDITGVTIAVMLATLAINLAVSRYERRKGEELQSQILVADAAHTRSDIFVSISVLGGFAAVRLGFPQADPLIAFAIAVLIARMGVAILYDAGQILADSMIHLPCDVEDVRRIVTGIPGVRDCHRFRCRGKPGDLYADLHITVDPRLSVDAAHNLSTDVERRLKERIAGMKEVVVHIEPAQR